MTLNANLNIVYADGHPTSRSEAAYRNAVLSDTPVFYWRLGEANKTTPAADETGNGHTGTYHTGGTYTFGEPASTQDTDVSAIVNSAGCAYVAAAGIWVTQHSFECWIKVASAQAGSPAVMGTWNSGNAAQQHSVVYINSTVLVFTVRDSAGTQHNAIGTTNITDGQWHHVVATIGASGAVLYLDGEVEASNVTPTSTRASTDPLVFGMYSNFAGTGYSGPIDECAYYNYQLTTGDVSAHWDAR